MFLQIRKSYMFGGCKIFISNLDGNIIVEANKVQGRTALI